MSDQRTSFSPSSNTLSTQVFVFFSQPYKDQSGLQLHVLESVLWVLVNLASGSKFSAKLKCCKNILRFYCVPKLSLLVLVSPPKKKKGTRCCIKKVKKKKKKKHEFLSKC